MSTNLKMTLATFIALTSTTSFAATTQLDCAVSEPPSIFHDVVILKDGSNLRVSYSYPGMRQDKWYGPFPGEYNVNNGSTILSFRDGTVISLNRQPTNGRLIGQVVLGLDGHRAPISCRKIH